MSNEIHSFSPSSRAFRRLPVVGDCPSPRCFHRGWSHEGKLFFFGGYVGAKPTPTKGVLIGEDHSILSDNLLCRFDPENNKWTAVTTSGPIPTPRCCFGVAQEGNFAFVHGGENGSSTFNDLTMLDMQSFAWTRIDDAGPNLWRHTLSSISTTKLFIIGGMVDGQASTKTWSFDRSSDRKWKEETPLPEPRYDHEVAAVTKAKGMSLIAFGGEIENLVHPTQSFRLDFD